MFASRPGVLVEEGYVQGTRHFPVYVAARCDWEVVRVLCSLLCPQVWGVGEHVLLTTCVSRGPTAASTDCSDSWPSWAQQVVGMIQLNAAATQASRVGVS